MTEQVPEKVNDTDETGQEDLTTVEAEDYPEPKSGTQDDEAPDHDPGPYVDEASEDA